jgi:hypothetical protein
MKRSPIKCISLLMTAIYLLITLSPLAANGLHSKTLSQLAGRQCTGDCRLCGCSAERSASHACCCWQKKLAEARARKELARPIACPASSNTAKRSCCAGSAQHEHHDHDAEVSALPDNPADADPLTVSITTCPCGSGADQDVSAGKTAQHIPFHFRPGLPVQRIALVSQLLPVQLTSRCAEPPDPPPKLTLHS